MSSSASSKAEVDWSADLFLDEHHIPTVKLLAQDLSSPGGVPQKMFRKVLQTVINYMTDTSAGGTQSLFTGQLQEALKSDESIATMFAGLHCILSSAVRQRVEPAAFKDQCAKMGMIDTFVADLAAVWTSQRDVLLANAQANMVRLPSLQSLQWRVDVTISTTSLSRVFRPSILMQMELSDGRIHVMECSVDVFHDLRYNVAKVLKMMNDMAENPILQRDL